LQHVLVEIEEIILIHQLSPLSIRYNMFPSQRLRAATHIRPLTTAHLAQTMSLLELSSGELEQKIEAELSRNPALEIKDLRRCPICGQPLVSGSQCPKCRPTSEHISSDPIVFVSPSRDYVASGFSGDDELLDENDFQTTDDLPTYVLRQIAPELAPEDRSIAAFILSNLDEDGLLEIPPVEIAQYHHVMRSRVMVVLRLIQRADPLGVGSPTPRDALLIQLEVLSETQRIPEFAARAIEQGLSLISRHQFPELGRLLGVPLREVEEIVQFISENLNPFPARAAWGDIRQGRSKPQPVFGAPDVIITGSAAEPDSPLKVEVFSPFAGMLRVNPLFREALQEAPDAKIDQWKSDLEQAELLVKCLQQRSTTIVRLMTRLAVLQRQFILNGDVCLQPLTRASLADELQVHESTISRAVSSKSVQLPNGRIVPLSKFFDRSLNVRTILKQIIDHETTPLSDNDLVDVLQLQGFNVARRTVAKYRAMEGILPSHLRSPALAASAI
jgi:RNA polymerase sigma-54 factor